MRRRGIALGMLLLLGAAPARAQDGDSADGLPPAGLGRLTQNDLAVRLRNDQIEIRFVPLDERMLRLLASDAYQSLHALVVARRPAVDSISRQFGITEPGVALVSFFGLAPGARFDPRALTVTGQSRELRPLGFVSLSPAFETEQLDVRQSATALYVFDEELPVLQGMTLAYGPLRSDDWTRRLPRFDRERARVSSRAP